MTQAATARYLELARELLDRVAAQEDELERAAARYDGAGASVTR